MRLRALKPHPHGDDADAAAIIAYTIASGSAPLLTPYAQAGDRLDRALARLTVASWRRADESPAVVDRIAQAGRQLASMRAARIRVDQEEARGQGGAQVAQVAEQPPPPAAPDNGPGSGVRRPTPPRIDPHGPNLDALAPALAPEQEAFALDF